MCQDGIYLGKVNLNYELPKVNFDNFRMGGFCGMVDDLKIYDYTLDYGNVVNSTAQKNVSYLFNLNRITGMLDIQIKIWRMKKHQIFIIYNPMIMFLLMKILNYKKCITKNITMRNQCLQ